VVGGFLFQGAWGLTIGFGTAIILSAVTLVILALRESKTMPLQVELYTLADANGSWDALLEALGNIQTNALVSMNRSQGKATLETRQSAVEISVQTLCPGECKITLRALAQENLLHRFFYGQALFLNVEAELSQIVRKLNRPAPKAHSTVAA
jgi:hypothetical protein